MENRPSADIYLLAKAKHLGGTVVTEEKPKPHSSQLPNLCDDEGVPWISYEDFMAKIAE